MHSFAPFCPDVVVFGLVVALRFLSREPSPRKLCGHRVVAPCLLGMPSTGRGRSVCSYSVVVLWPPTLPPPSVVVGSFDDSVTVLCFLPGMLHFEEVADIFCLGANFLRGFSRLFPLGFQTFAPLQFQNLHISCVQNCGCSSIL